MLHEGHKKFQSPPPKVRKMGTDSKQATGAGEGKNYNLPQKMGRERKAPSSK